jgi:hypothetical protein
MVRLLSLAFVALWVLPGCRCSRSSPEEQVRKTIDEVVRAAHERDLKRMVAAVSEQYSDAQGNKKSDIAGMVRVQFLLHPNLYLVAKLSSLECPEATQARVAMFAAMASVPGGGGVPDLRKLSADVYRFDLTMIDEDGDWRVVRAAWAPATLQDLL